MSLKKIAILGSTGSIGTNALSIIKKTKNSFKIELLLAKNNFKKISEQIRIFKPKIVVILNPIVFVKIKKKFKFKKIIFLNKLNYIDKYLKKIDITISAIPGIAGLEPTIIFIKKSNKILLANKESIVCGWDLIKKNLKKNKTKLVAIDSEHFSIEQLTKNYKNDDIEKIYITASGGPFLNLNKKKFKFIKPRQAIKHPKWKMGSKISVDSATLMNKILELVEAKKLFPFDFKKYEIVIHPQSLVHAIVRFKNGLTKLLYHEPDMRIPISNALFDNKLESKNFINKKKNNIKNLQFLPVDNKRFPSIKLIPKMNQYRSTPIILNAANEIFVDHFLKSKISFSSIYQYLSLVLKDRNYINYAKMRSDKLKNIQIIDQWSRKLALDIINKKN